MKRERLIAERKRNGWSQNSVAKLLDIAEITVRSIENGSR
ncbi:helix-turn-helix domain-containing protein, partial [Lactiplantibacillus plantarum]